MTQDSDDTLIPPTAVDGSADQTRPGGLRGLDAILEGDPGQPRRIGAYDVLEQIGEGGQGVVLKARHTKLGTLVALKLLLIRDDRMRLRFQQEAKVLARLKHPNLPQVTDLGEVGPTPFLAMEFVEGEDLRSRVDSGGIPPFEWSVSALATIARTVHYCHEQGVIHRDLKPANVLIESGSDRPVLADFGLIKRDPEQLPLSPQDRSPTVVGETKGTPSFMAPEQVDAEQFGEVEARTDVYGLGGVLYYLLTGKVPFTGTSAYSIVVKVVQAAPLDPREHNPQVPPALAGLCLRALAKAKDDRPASAADLADQLEATLTNPATVSDTSTQSRLIPLILGVAAVLLVVALGVFMATRQGDGAEEAETAKKRAAVKPASGYTWDGFKLGDDYAFEVRARGEHWKETCDNDPVDGNKRRVMIYTALKCRNSQFPQQTTVLFYLKFSDRDRYSQPIQAFAYLNGSYFDDKSDFPLKIGDPFREATELLGEPQRKFPFGDLRAYVYEGDIVVLTRKDRIYGFVFGPMPEEPRNDQWGVLYQMYDRYTPH